MQGVSKKKLYSCIPNVTLWRVLRRRLRLKVYKLPMDSLYAFKCKGFRNTLHAVTFGNHRKAPFETPCIIIIIIIIIIIK
jgi:hypothetical protein